MFNFNINFRRRILDNLPIDLRTPRRLLELKVMIKPFRVIYNEFTAKRKELIYKAVFNGEVIYLETALNDKFDPVSRGITITDPSYPNVYVYGRAELQTNPILYSRWNNATNFITGKYCVYNGVVYQSNTTPNVNKVPGVDPQWTVKTYQTPKVRSRANYSGAISMTINIPAAVSFSESELRGIVKYYKLAGIGYQIKIV